MVKLKKKKNWFHNFNLAGKNNNKITLQSYLFHQPIKNNVIKEKEAMKKKCSQLIPKSRNN